MLGSFSLSVSHYSVSSIDCHPQKHLSTNFPSFFLSHVSQLQFCTFFRLGVAHSSTSSWELGLAVLITFSTFKRKNHGVAKSRAITLIDLPAVTPPCTPTSDNIIKHSFSFLSTLVFLRGRRPHAHESLVAPCALAEDVKLHVRIARDQPRTGRVSAVKNYYLQMSLVPSCFACRVPEVDRGNMQAYPKLRTP